ncbi:hypothetical protein [Clostridium arbusti]|uniref:hypothetical protein n=1 Tax=Clostridium arbusti TaxID=1137848 RepID=UPI00028823AA|nr:hypothetical protein [Clostridium arbusti]
MYYSYNRYQEPEEPEEPENENREEFYNLENDDSFQEFEVPPYEEPPYGAVPYYSYRHMPPEPFGYFQYDDRQYDDRQYDDRQFNPTAPSGPPPSSIPAQPQQFHSAGGPGGPQVMAVDPGSIRPCLFRFVYIWPRRGRGFWAWLTFVGRRSASGFRWNGRRWIYFGIDLREIQSFECR